MTFIVRSISRAVKRWGVGMFVNFRGIFGDTVLLIIFKKNGS